MQLNFDYSKILRSLGEDTINRIGGNIFKAGITRSGINTSGQYYESPTRQGANASGKTVQSLRVESSPLSLVIYGRENFHQLETGVPPSNGVSPANLLTWGQYKNKPFGREYTLKSAISHAKNINEKGTKLYQLGGRKDIYSNEIEPLIERISNQITTELVNIKLVENGD